MSHWISVIRFVPDPAKGEFINVAAIAGEDESEEVEVRSVGNWGRAKRMDTGSSLSGVVDFVTGLQGRVELAQQDLEESPLTRSVVETMSDEMQNIVQLTRPIPVLTPSVDAALDLAFRELIVDPATRTFDFQKKHGAMKALKEAYRARDVHPILDARVLSGPYDTRFDFAVANGRAVQLVRCWSFQLPDQRELADQVRAWAWGVRAIRLGQGGDAVFREAAPVTVPPDVDVEVVFIPPVEGQESREAFEVAGNVFADSDAKITAVSIGEAFGVASRAVGLLSHSLSAP